MKNSLNKIILILVIIVFMVAMGFNSHQAQERTNQVKGIKPSDPPEISGGGAMARMQSSLPAASVQTIPTPRYPFSNFVNPNAPPLLNTIEGFDFNDNGTETGFLFIPPDPIGAAGQNHVVAVVNVMIEWYLKDGTFQFRDALRDFFTPLTPTTYTFDPKVIYDQYTDRFVVVTLEVVETGINPDPGNISRILLAVSDDSDPNGTWHFHAIDAKTVIGGTVEHWADYPGFAVDEEAVYVTANMFAFDGASTVGGVRLWIVDKGLGSGGFYDGGAASVSFHNPYATSGGFDVTTQPAHIFGSGGVGTGVGTFLVGYSGLTDGVNEYLQVVRVDDPLGTPTFSTFQSINMGNIENTALTLPDAPQLGSGAEIEVNDRRALHAIWRNDALWTCFEILPASGPDAFQTTAHWVQLGTTTLSNLNLIDQGNVGGEDIASGTFTFFPSIAVDGSDNMAIGFSACASTIYAGAYYTGRLAGDPPGTVQPSGTLRAGLDSYQRTFGGPRNRWGDYSGMSVDPADDAIFWVFNEYAITRGTGTPPEDGRWGTAWGSYTFQAQPPADKLLVSEFVVTPTIGEFVEIYNPNSTSIDLSDYYLTDATFAAGGLFYYNIVTDANYGGGDSGDFHARFPDGATIQPGEYQTIALNGDADFFGEYGINPTYEMDQAEHASGVPDAIPDMQEAVLYSIFGSDSTNNPNLTNDDEIIILYHWDGMSDLVGDVDYVLYNSASPASNNKAVDKTGVRIDGPDADTDSSEYLPDTPTANQLSAINHGVGASVHRTDFAEGSQISSGGNGVSGTDETSENLDQTFSNNSIPSPNAAWEKIKTARVQLVHNAADPALAVVDVYLNGIILVNDFNFREATPFIDAAAGIPLNFGFAPGTSSSVADTIRNFPVVFDTDSTYIGFASGVLDTLNFLPNPDGEDISFTIHGKDRAREISQTADSVEVFAMHGITDVPAVDLNVRGGGILFNDVIYSEATDYVVLSPDIYILDITDSTGSDFFATFELDLTGFADSALALFASGFAEPDSNQGGLRAGMFAALPNGTVIELPQVANYAKVQFIHNSPDSTLDTVDIYLNDSLLVDDLVFREGTRFLDFPANFDFLLGIAPGNSTSVGDTILAFDGELPPNFAINGLLSGVLDTANFAPNPDGLDISFEIGGTDTARMVSNTPGSVEFYVMHGATDAPAVDVVARGVGTLFEDVFYSDVTEYIDVPPASYTIDLYDSSGTTLLAAFTADLSSLADSALTVFASGFMDTAANQNGPAFGLFACLSNGTVIELPAIPVGITGSDPLVPMEYALHQNYPNPFNPTTTIKYDLKQAGDVQLIIYNLLGQKIRTLVNAVQEPGYQSVVWDGRNDSGMSVASGIYIYRIEAGDYVNTRKMILMK